MTLAPAQKTHTPAPGRSNWDVGMRPRRYRPPSSSPTSKGASPQLTATYQSWARLRSAERRYHAKGHVPRGLDRTPGAYEAIVHPEWMQSFDTFIQDMGIRPPGTSLDRRDQFQPFIPGNCYWRKRPRPGKTGADPAVYIEHNGRKQSLAIWAEDLGIAEAEVLERFRHDDQAGATALESSTSANA